MYDIFYVSRTTGNNNDWIKIKSKYSTAQKLINIDNYDQIVSRAFTKMFWVIWDDLHLNESFDLLQYRATKWDNQYVHVFKNGEYHDGICLFPKNLNVSKKEFDHRFFIEKKEVDIVASIPSIYDKFVIKSYKEYLDILENYSKDMFWCIWPDIEIIDESIFNMYFSHHNSYDRNENHVFKNICQDKFSYLDGVVLFSGNKKISKREFDRRYLIDKKEHDILASRNRYKRYKIDNYDQYLDILKKETQPLFWAIWPEVEVTDESVFDLYFDPRDGKYDHDRSENHVFKNSCDKSESYYNGIVLFSKNKPISKKEFDRRYLIDKKEHDQVVSRYTYSKYVINSYDEYLDILKKETQPLFWAIWPEVEITDESVFDLYFDPRDGKYDHDRSENHSFKNLFRNEETHANGVMLLSKNKKIGKKEFDHRFLIEKKEQDRLVSKFKPYDIVFISYREPNAEENYQTLLKKFPLIYRVHGIKGIHQAHIKAAEIARSEMFWAVDGDALIEEDFLFDYETSTYERDTVHVWRSRNPINDLVYGYGGIKLLPRKLTLGLDINSPDMTTAISKKFKAVPVISNVTAFNTDPFNTWKSAFRECVKLSSRIIDRQKEEETKKRLDIWCSAGKDKKYGEFAITGAIAGREFGKKYKEFPEKIRLINDFDWLKKTFEEKYD